jgi:hypothetical protein
MHLDFANALNLVSTVTLIGALVFTGMQVRAANRARRDQAAVTVIETARSKRKLGALFRIAQRNSGRCFRGSDREFKCRNEAPDFSVRTSGGNNRLHGFSRFS